MTFNQVGLAGIVGKEPKFETTTTGINYCQFTLVVDSSFTGKNGLVNKSDHFPIKAWGKVCEEAKNKLTVGSSVLISGSLKKDTWKDTSGNMQYMVSINASGIQYMDEIIPVSKSNTDMVKEAFPGKVKNGIDLPDDLPF